MPNRKENNSAIVDILHEIVNYNPDLRFCQILDIIGLRLTEDKFYEEPWDTLKRILKNKNLDALLNGNVLG